MSTSRSVFCVVAIRNDRSVFSVSNKGSTIVRSSVCCIETSLGSLKLRLAGSIVFLVILIK